MQYAPDNTRQNRANGQEGAVANLEYEKNTGDPGKVRCPTPARETIPDSHEGGGAGYQSPVSPTNVKPGERLLALEVCPEIGPGLGDINEAKHLGTLLRLIM